MPEEPVPGCAAQEQGVATRAASAAEAKATSATQAAPQAAAGAPAAADAAPANPAAAAPAAEPPFIEDPWARSKTRNGLPGDEVISALQKSIRRGNERAACEFAYEMYITSPAWEEKLWRRLLAISVEDIGMGNPKAAVLVNALNQMRQTFQYNESDRAMFFFHAIRYLCESQKDRSTDFLKNIVIKSFAMGYVPEIPDYALDKHTVRGQQMGRGSEHFFNVACRVTPQAEVDNTYREEYGELLKRYDPSKTVPSAFTFSAIQA